MKERGLSLRWRIFGAFFSMTAVVLSAFAVVLHAQRSAVLYGSLGRELTLRAATIGGLCEMEHGELQIADSDTNDGPRLQLLQSAAVATWPELAFATGERALLDAVRAHVVAGEAAVFVDLPDSLACALIVDVPARAAHEGESAQDAFTVLVATSGSTTSIGNDLAQLRANLLLVGCSVLAVACGLALWLARRIVVPIAALAQAAGRTQAGQRVPMPRGGSSELAELAEALDGALTRLEDARERQSRFAADASHELRTPIAIVRTQIEVMQLEAFDAERCRQDLAVMLDAVKRMATTVESLLMLARADAGGFATSFDPCDLADVVKTEVALHAASAEEHGLEIAVLAPTAANSTMVCGDPGLLRTLIGNLVGNAIRHSQRAGTIRVEVSATADAIDLAVVDTGCGIEASALPRVFERFFRADESRSRATGGVGLGLAVVKAIAVAHGATCTVVSTAGFGTTVRVAFPAARAVTKG